MTVLAYTSAAPAPLISQSDAVVGQASLPQNIQLYGAGEDTSDPGATFTYLWSIISAPPGSTAALSSSTAQNPLLNGVDVWGNYLVMLVVTSSTGGPSASNPLQAPDTARVGVQVTSASAGIQKTARGERNWFPPGYWPVVDKVEQHDQVLASLTSGVQPGGTLTVQAGENLAAGDVVYPSGIASATVLVVSKAPATNSWVTDSQLLVMEGAVSSGAQGTARWFGLSLNVPSGSPSVGDFVYVSDTATLSLTAGTNSRVIGQVVQASGGTYHLSVSGQTAPSSAAPSGTSLCENVSAGTLVRGVVYQLGGASVGAPGLPGITEIANPGEVDPYLATAPFALLESAVPSGSSVAAGGLGVFRFSGLLEGTLTLAGASVGDVVYMMTGLTTLTLDWTDAVFPVGYVAEVSGSNIRLYVDPTARNLLAPPAASLDAQVAQQGAPKIGWRPESFDGETLDLFQPKLVALPSALPSAGYTARIAPSVPDDTGAAVTPYELRWTCADPNIITESVLELILSGYSALTSAFAEQRPRLRLGLEQGVGNPLLTFLDAYLAVGDLTGVRRDRAAGLHAFRDNSSGFRWDLVLANFPEEVLCRQRYSKTGAGAFDYTMQDNRIPRRWFYKNVANDTIAQTIALTPTDNSAGLLKLTVIATDSTAGGNCYHIEVWQRYYKEGGAVAFVGDANFVVPLDYDPMALGIATNAPWELSASGGDIELVLRNTAAGPTELDLTAYLQILSHNWEA